MLEREALAFSSPGRCVSPEGSELSKIRLTLLSFLSLHDGNISNHVTVKHTELRQLHSIYSVILFFPLMNSSRSAVMKQE